jgi:curli biogenesis system outer membrane secretion channel CsgG
MTRRTAARATSALAAALCAAPWAIAAPAWAQAGVAPAARSAPDTRPTVAVMYFNNGAIGPANKDLEPLTKGVADILITELSANAEIRVVERDQLQRLLDEQNLSASGRVDEGTALRLGKILGAHHMIFGGFVTDLRGNMRLDARAVEVQTSKVEHVETVQGKMDNVMVLITDLAAKLNRGMNLPELPKAVREARGEQAKKVPVSVTLLYARALMEKDGGNAAGAVELLQRSLAEFPSFEPAKRELAKLQPAKTGE